MVVCCDPYPKCLKISTSLSFFLFKVDYYYLFIFGCCGSSLLCGLSLVVAGGGYSLAVPGLLIAVVSLFVQNRLSSCRTWA